MYMGKQAHSALCIMSISTKLIDGDTHTVNAVINSLSCQTANTKQTHKPESVSTMWLFHRWGSSDTSAPGPGAYDQSTMSMQTEVEKRTTNTARHGAFGVGERFAQSKAPDSAAVSMTYSALSQFAPEPQSQTGHNTAAQSTIFLFALLGCNCACCIMIYGSTRTATV